MKKGDTNMEKIEFKEYRDPAYWMRRRQKAASNLSLGLWEMSRRRILLFSL